VQFLLRVEAVELLEARWEARAAGAFAEGVEGLDAALRADLAGHDVAKDGKDLTEFQLPLHGALGAEFDEDLVEIGGGEFGGGAFQLFALRCGERLGIEAGAVENEVDV